MAKKTKHTHMGMGSCCGSWNGVIHVVGGVGLGFLLASYVVLPNLVMFGWGLLALSLLGHLLGWTKCKSCGM